MDPYVKIVGLGGAGFDIVEVIKNKLDVHPLKGVECCAFDKEEKGWQNRIFEKTEAESAFADCSRRLLILVGALGGVFGSNAMIETAAKAHDFFDNVGAFFTIPFRFEGFIRIINTQRALDSLKQNVDFFAKFSNSSFLKDNLVDAKVPSDEVLASADDAIVSANEEIAESIYAFLRMIKDVENEIFTDYADVRALIRQKNGMVKRIDYRCTSAQDENWSVDCLKNLSGICGDKFKGKASYLVYVCHNEKIKLTEFHGLLENFSEIVELDDNNFLLLGSNNGLETGVKVYVWMVTDE